tara:strand:- start:75 stop:356 length:282 start_codon:yes stop_codon:yes gene_type:complete
MLCLRHVKGVLKKIAAEELTEMNTGTLAKINDDHYWQQLYRRLLKSGLIRYSRTKGGRACFEATPAGRKFVQDALAAAAAEAAAAWRTQQQQI